MKVTWNWNGTDAEWSCQTGLVWSDVTEAKVTLVNQIQQQDINAHNPPEELFDISYYYSKFPAGDINKLNIFPHSMKYEDVYIYKHLRIPKHIDKKCRKILGLFYDMSVNYFIFVFNHQ